ncbi:MAG: 30S ribosomal protein S6 [candidate division Zixibacteria bacterium]|nr:30S ribosomal protein S6 [candidate division Zixibacteria bacterium]
MKKYETTFVLDAGVDTALIDSEIGNLEKIITENGGKVLKVEKWGVKRFAYELKKRHQGNYFHVKFEGTGELPGLLNRHFQIDEHVLRHLTVVSEEVGGMEGALERERTGASEKKTTSSQSSDEHSRPTEEVKPKAEPSGSTEEPNTASAEDTGATEVTSSPSETEEKAKPDTESEEVETASTVTSEDEDLKREADPDSINEETEEKPD